MCWNIAWRQSVFRPKTIPLLHIKIFVVLHNILFEQLVPLSMKTYKRFTLTLRELHKDMNS